MTASIRLAFTSLAAVTMLLTACATPGGDDAQSEGAASSPVAAGKPDAGSGGDGETAVAGAFGEVSECAIAGSPWTVDTTALGETIAANMANQGGAVDRATSTGVYVIEFGRDGTFVITSAGVSNQVFFSLADGPATFTYGYTAGGSTAQWAEVEGYGDGSVIKFTNWVGGIEPTFDDWDRELTTIAGTEVGSPVWDLTWASGEFAIECSEKELRIALKTAPDTMPLYFRRSA